MGYGPLVRATTGVTRLWTSVDDPGFYDATTIFPDHVVARITAIAALASLIASERAGTGAHVHISQAEAAVNQLAATYVTDAARTAKLPVAEDPGLHGVYPCAGEDEWCVISLRSDCDREALATVMDRSDLPDDRGGLVDAVSAWTSRMDKGAVAETASGGRRARRADEPRGRRARRSCAAAPEVVHRHGASAVRPPDAHRDQSRTIRAHPAGGTAACADARRAHPRDLPEAAGTRHRRDRPTDRRRRAVHLRRRGRNHDTAEDAGAGRLRTGQSA